jgi:hypothetical protein
MSMISFGVAIERIYTFTGAQTVKLRPGQKHLKEGSDATRSPRQNSSGHLAKIVLAGCRNISSSMKRRRLSPKTWSTPFAAPFSVPA